jgi:hypothetical protein
MTAPLLRAHAAHDAFHSDGLLIIDGRGIELTRCATTATLKMGEMGSSLSCSGAQGVIPVSWARGNIRRDNGD